MINDPMLAQPAGFDVQSLFELKQQIKQKPQQGVRAAAQAVEGMFIELMLKSMRDTLPKGGIFDSSQSQLYASLYDQQLAQALSHKGLGLADMLLKQWNSHPLSQQNSLPQAVDNANSLALAQASTIPPAHLANTTHFPYPDPHFSSAVYSPSQPSQNWSFLARLAAPVQKVAHELGIPNQLIMAQAALESGWGSKEITLPNGQPSHNLFGVKAGAQWHGKSVTVMTTEYIDGIAKKVEAPFRVYASYAEGLRDYLQLLLNNPRYTEIMKQKTPHAIAHALQNAGYSTDPHYAEKLITLLSQIKKITHKLVHLYQPSDGQ